MRRSILAVMVLLQGCAGGSATRLEKGALDQAQENLYSCPDPLDPGHYGNVFRFSDGRAVAVWLMAQSRAGRYAGERIGVGVMADGEPSFGVIDYPLDGSDLEERFEHKSQSYSVSIEDQGGDSLITVRDEHGASAQLSLLNLFKWRTMKKWKADTEIGGKHFKILSQGGVRTAWLFFPETAANAYLNPDARRPDFSPTFVVEIRESNVRIADVIPIADTGYALFWDAGGQSWDIRQVR